MLRATDKLMEAVKEEHPLGDDLAVLVVQDADRLQPAPGRGAPHLDPIVRPAEAGAASARHALRRRRRADLQRVEAADQFGSASRNHRRHDRRARHDHPTVVTSSLSVHP